MKYICDCTENSKKADEGRGIWREVGVHDDETCVHCGHYAMAFRNVKVDKHGRISPQYELQSLYGDANNERKRKLNENGNIYWDNQSLQDVLEWWKAGKTFDEKNAEWFNVRRSRLASAYRVNYIMEDYHASRKNE